MTVTLENERLRVEVSTHGAEIVSVYDKRRGCSACGQATESGGSAIPRCSFPSWAPYGRALCATGARNTI